MNAYNARDGIDCYIVVPPQFRPQIYTGISFLNGNNLRAKLTIIERKNENRIELANGRMDIYKMGDVRKDLSLKIVGSDPETERVIEEIINRNIPVYLYPRAGGNLQLNVPLVRGLGTDPVDASGSFSSTFTLTTSTGTTVYMPRGDSGLGIYLEAIDESAPLLDGVWTGNGTQSQLPAGRGMPFFDKVKNLLKNSLMSAVTYVAPYTVGSEWGAYTSASDVWGTDHGLRQSMFCSDANAYWTKSTTTRLTSYSFNIPTGTTIHLSFCYRVDGTMQVSLKDSGGTVRWSKAISPGSGRTQLSTTGVAPYAGAYFEVTLSSGSFCEISCMQFMDGDTQDITEFQPFLGTESNTTEAEVTGNGLQIDRYMGADSVAYTATTADRDGAVLVSGYTQPMYSDAYRMGGSVVAEMESAYSRLGMRMHYSGGNYRVGILVDGVETTSQTITGHELGDIYAWGIWSGYKDGTGRSDVCIVRLRDDASFTATDASTCMFPNILRIGHEQGGDSQADAIISAVTVESMSYDYCRTTVNRLADCSVLNIIRDTIGRWYTLDRAISPKKYKSDANAGTLTATEVRAI